MPSSYSFHHSSVVRSKILHLLLLVNYRYHANGRLQSASVARGGEHVLEYDARGRKVSGAGTAF